MTGDRPVIGICTRDRERALGRVGGALQPLAAHLLAGRAARRRASRCCCRPTTRWPRRPTRCSTCSTGSCWPAAPTWTRAPTAPGPHAETKGTLARARPLRAGARPPARSSATCPCSGVCRGMQMLNVVRGGTIDQHLPDAWATRTTAIRPGVFSDHEVRLDPGSLRGARWWAPSAPRSSPTTTRGSRSSARAWWPPAGPTATRWWRRSRCPTARFALGRAVAPRGGRARAA